MKIAGSIFFSAVLLGMILWGKGLQSPMSVPEPLITPENPVELGLVRWQRDLEAGLSEAARTGKPALILFQEVPGCGNCTRYGSFTLSHPLIVEAIESYFVPICVFNNKGGADAKALKRFNEPSWNNPVVRIVDSKGKDLVPRMANFRSSAEIVAGMMEASGNNPKWMQLLEEELRIREEDPATATYTMFCFWSGEKALASQPGVIQTEAGFQNGREVVRVVYDGEKTSDREIEKAVQKDGITRTENDASFKRDRTPKYYLAQTYWRYVPMTSLQAAKANALAGSGKMPETVLSPRQIELGKYIRKHPNKGWENAIGTDSLVKSWAKATKKMKKA